MPLHLYGVMWSHAALPSGLEGRGGASPHVVVDDDLAAVVGAVESGAAPRRQDLLAHAHALEACVEQETVIPARFGMLFDDEQAVCRRVLREQGDLLRHLLSVFDGLQQVTLKVSLDPDAALREVMARRPDVRAARDALTSVQRAKPQMYELVGFGRELALEVAELRDRERLAVFDRLAHLARAVCDNDTSGEWEAVNAAFLVDRTVRPGFDLEVRRLEHEDTRRRVRYVGPQPPYSFLEPAQSGELTWA